MRIVGQGSGGFSRDDSPSGDRAKRFRRRRRVGEVLLGFVTHWETSELAWVEIDGDPLLARLPGDIPLGREVRLLVETLDPDITLRRLPDDASAPRRLNLRV